MYSSGLVPRRMTWLGMIGGPLLLIGNLRVLFDWWDGPGPAGPVGAPEISWEAFLGICRAVWGCPADCADSRGPLHVDFALRSSRSRLSSRWLPR